MYKALASSCLAVSFNGAFLISCSSCLEIKLKKKKKQQIHNNNNKTTANKISL